MDKYGSVSWCLSLCFGNMAMGHRRWDLVPVFSWKRLGMVHGQSVMANMFFQL